MESLSSLFGDGLAVCYSLIPNWGCTIIVFTFCLRSLLLPVQRLAQREQKKLKTLDPELKQLQVEYKNDLPRQLRERSALLEKNGVRSWLIFATTAIQIPIFISVYRAIASLKPLSGAAFVWLPSLAAADPLFVLPALSALFIWVQLRATSDPVAARLSLSLLSFAFLVKLPSGLALYSIVSSMLQFISQRGLDRWN
jgi:YidC/Oxa1 family membrane protein insertase